MTFFDRFRESVKETAAAATEATNKLARRAQLEIKESRLQARVRREKTAIGEAIYPLLASGDLQIDLAEVQTALARIEVLNEQLAENAAELDALATAPPGKPPLGGG
ncbi:MAG: hypothetical protein CL897_03965 [Dehalococcoidia bacterium]|nr:hypothetical protein [Dehalococcoidia bacterium]HCV00899.1 hypothetical protein [Dehalococcoidia bacterium]|tara:strand:- start:4657 stop:4977 length:321 start_codon:yes stop_codon:yes gene_type:complete